MAYNPREWDQGKDNWKEGYSGWPAVDSKPYIRQREDEYLGEPKRRKFNDGGYQGYAGNDEGGYGGGHGHTRHQDHTSSTQDYSYDDRSRNGSQGGFPKKRLMPSEPSPHVIFLGLDPDFTEADLQAYLTTYGCTLETVTIIRDRSSGVSKGFGFAQFATTEQAQAFVDPLFPFVQMPPPASHGASARNAFYAALEQQIPHNGRRVKIDYSQSASPHERGRPKANANDGTRDIGNAQSAVLLFRGLDPLSGPQAIHQAMLTSCGPGKQGAKGMKRIILIKDKVTMASFGFAFVEFIDVESASAVLAATMSPQLHPNGFRVSDKPIAASFAHPYSFQPVTDFLQRDEACLLGSQSLGNPDNWVRYWDEASTVAVLDFKVEEPAKAVAPQEKKKERKKAKDSDPRLSTPAAPSALPLSNKPVMLSLSKGPVKMSIGSSSVKALGNPGLSLDDEADQEDDDREPNKPMPVKRVAPLIASKKIASNINKWNQVQEVLHGDAEPQVQSTSTAPPSTLSKPKLPPKSAEPSPSPEDEFEFSDTNALMCLLCSRQFKSIDQLRRHNKESDLHKKNHKDHNLRESARQKVAARKASSGQSKEELTKYRDRASERRVLFNQPDLPLPDNAQKESSSGKKRHTDGPPRPSPPPPPAHPAQDETNVGNKLLKMMGWKEGTGLGTDGEGRVEPIQTAMYAQGVGLGASKAKDITKYTDGYSGYVHMAQDSARERYGA